MLRKHAAKFRVQLDTYLCLVLWAYRNTPHDSTGEKPTFLLYGYDCYSPTETALLPPNDACWTDRCGWLEEIVLSLLHARESAAKSICKAQQCYKTQYDKIATSRRKRLVSGCLYSFHRKKREGLESSVDPGMGNTGLCQSLIKMRL